MSRDSTVNERVERYRERQAKRGVTRIQIMVPVAMADHFKALAEKARQKHRRKRAK